MTFAYFGSRSFFVPRLLFGETFLKGSYCSSSIQVMVKHLVTIRLEENLDPIGFNETTQGCGTHG